MVTEHPVGGQVHSTPLRRMGLLRPLAVLVFLGMATGAVLGWTSYQQSRGLIEQAQERGRAALANALAVGLADQLVTEDFAGIESRLELAMADENITSALVTDSRGKVLVHLLRPRPAEMPQLVFAPERINPPRFDLEAPVTTNGISSRWTAIEAGETVGWLQLRTWLSSTDAVLNLLARQYLLLGGLAAGLVGTLVATGYGEVRRQAKLREQQVNQEKAALEYIALIDPLTGLFNRRGVERALNETLLDSSSRAEAALAICMIDLDDFKPVNDTYGHDVGDQLLTAVGQRLKSYLREGDCVGRIGGDEFIAVFRHCPERAQATALAKRISDGLGMPFQIGSLLLRIGASVGVVIDAEQQIAPDFMPYPADIASSGEKSMASIHLESLMQQADRAMYTVKQNGKSQIAIAPPALKG